MIAKFVTLLLQKFTVIGFVFCVTIYHDEG